MTSTIFSKLYRRLAELLPIETAAEGFVFCAKPRHPEDLAVYCQVTSVNEHGMVIDLADDNAKCGAMPRPWVRFRVDVAQQIAEVLELEDSFGYQVVYTGNMQINPRRAQMNLYTINWLYMLNRFTYGFERVNNTAKN